MLNEQYPVVQSFPKKHFRLAVSIFISILLLSVLVVGVFAARNLLWQDQFGEFIQNESATGAATLGDKVFVSGWGDNENFEYYWLIRAFDGRTGNIIWEDQYLANSEPSEGAIVAEDNRLFVAGSQVVSGQFHYDWLVLAYDADTGALLWQEGFDLAEGYDYAAAVDVQNDQLFVAGSATNDTGDLDWVVRAYSPTDGTLLWQDQFGIPGASLYSSQIAAQGNQLFVAGRVFDPNSGQDWLLRVYDTDTGLLLWQDQFDLANGSDFLADMAVNRNAVITVGSGWNENGNSDWLVRAYNTADGSLQWQDQLDIAAGFESARAITIQGRQVFVAGSGSILRVYRIDNGSLLWEDTGSGGTYRQIAFQRGQIILAGTNSSSSDFFGWQVTAFNARRRTLLWQDFYGDGGGVYDLAVSDTEAFVVGNFDPTGFIADWLVRAYSLTIR